MVLVGWTLVQAGKKGTLLVCDLHGHRGASDTVPLSDWGWEQTEDDSWSLQM